MGSRGSVNIEILRRLLVRRRVADLDALQRATDGRSQGSLFRDLAKLDYVSSFTHAGRFYTLLDIPRFDEHGLWFYRDIGFSQAGSLKNTLELLVDRSLAGFFHRELERIVRVDVHNPLLDLCRTQRIQRQSLGPHRLLYLSPDQTRAHEQLEKRKTMLIATPLPQPPIHLGSLDTIIAILVETIHAAKRLPSVAEVSRRLALRNLPVGEMQVEQLWAHYGIDKPKKTVESKPEPSKR